MKDSAKDTIVALPAKKTLLFADNMHALQIFGPQGEHLKFLEDNVPVRIKSRGNEVILEGTAEQVNLAEKCLTFLEQQLLSGHAVQKKDLMDCLKVFGEGVTNPEEVFRHEILLTGRKNIRPRTLGQKRYIESIEKHDMVFGIGPAGTGKTYLAMAVAMSKLLHGKVERIILTRPAVEAGEKLGFLPGNLVEKIDPYLRPLYDALHDMVDVERAKRFVESGQIEVAPLAFMRGRTLNDSFVILDEAQNTTREQMKMFLTRIGANAQAVITGDITQIDLPDQRKSGLIQAIKILQNVEGIQIHKFNERDVVRHPLVAKIIRAYDSDSKLP